MNRVFGDFGFQVLGDVFDESCAFSAYEFTAAGGQLVRFVSVDLLGSWSCGSGVAVHGSAFLASWRCRGFGVWRDGSRGCMGKPRVMLSWRRKQMAALRSRGRMASIWSGVSVPERNAATKVGS